MARQANLKFYPATSSRWKDIEKLFGKKGACSGCWCMWWRQTASQFSKLRGNGNRKIFKKMIETDQVPGILAYADGQPVGWCAIEPRENYLRLGRSRVLKPVDDKPVWAVVCFFVAKDNRRKGVSVELLKGAVDYARKKKAVIVEGYPVETKSGKLPDPWVWTGLYSAFKRAGFKEVLRRSTSRPIMRYAIEKQRL